MADWHKDNIELMVVRTNLTTLLYSITTQPRLFRWHNGELQWRKRFSRKWYVLSMWEAGELDGQGQ